MEQPPKQSIRGSLPYLAAFLVMGAALVWRCRYGFDWSDETYYTALTYRLALGSRLFSDMWEIHQLSALPLLPLMRLFLLCSGGSTDGVILFFRTAFCVVQTLCAICAFFLLKKRYAPLAAFLASGLVLMFAHFALSNLSYDTMPVLLLFLSVALQAGAKPGRSRVLYALSGACYALAVQCYPQLVVTLPVFAVYFALRARQARLFAGAAPLHPAKGPGALWKPKGKCLPPAGFPKGVSPFGGSLRGRRQAPPVADEARRRPSEQGDGRRRLKAATRRDLCELWREAEPSTSSDPTVRNRAPLYFALGIALLLGAFLIGFFARSSVAELRSNLPFLLSDPSHPAADYAHLLMNYVHTILVILGPAAYALVAVTAAAAALPLLRREIAREKLRRALYVACALLLIAMLARVLFYDTGSANKNNFFALPLAVFAPALFFLNGRKRDASILLFALGAAFSLSAHLSSNMGIYASSFPLILCSAATVLYASRCALPMKTRTGRAAAYAAAFAALLCVSAFRILGVHRDAPITKLDTALAAGPAQGIVTTAASAEQYASVVGAIRTYAPETGSVVMTSMLPFGYLCTDLLPATPSVWHSPYTERLKTYYARHPDLLPDMIVSVPEGVGMSYGPGGADELAAYLSAAYGRVYERADTADCNIWLLHK